MRKYLNQYNMMKHLPELALLEFNHHIKNDLNFKDKNQMISALIELRKVLLKRDKYAPNETITPIHDGYTIDSTMNADRHLYTLIVRRPTVAPAQDVNAKESFDKLTLDELGNFLQDFVIELFTCYNFCEYQSTDDINVDKTSVSEDGQDTITITVTTIDPQKKLYLYVDKDPKTSEEYDS